MSTIEPYVRRSVEFLNEAAFQGWRIKVYELSAESVPLPKKLVTISLDALLSNLPQPAMTEDRYGVGFAIIHRGTLRNWLLLDWWEYEDILHHRLFSSPLDDFFSISEEKSAAIACVHELKIISFECEAWIRTVLSANTESSIEAYLGEVFEWSGDFA